MDVSISRSATRGRGRESLYTVVSMHFKSLAASWQPYYMTDLYLTVPQKLFHCSITSLSPMYTSPWVWVLEY